MAPKRSCVVPDIKKNNRISVLWELEDIDAITGEKKREWFDGVVMDDVKKKDKALHIAIKYDDGEEKIEKLNPVNYGITFKLLRECEMDDEDTDIDYWGLLDEIKKRTKLLQETVDDLKKEVEKLKSNKNTSLDEGLDPDRFARLSDVEKKKYHNNTGMTGVIKPHNFEDNTSSYTMCCFYKNLDKPCVGKTLVRFKNGKNEKVEEKYQSPKAEYIPKSILAKSTFRKTCGRQARDIAKNYMMCRQCAKDVDTITIPHIAELCMFCRSTRTTKQNPKICQMCLEKHSSRERGLKYIFEILNVFDPSLLITVNKYSLGNFVDLSMSGTYENKRYLIVIESDEQQHLSGGYDVQSDNTKMAKQTAVLMHNLKKNESDYPLVFMIRFNPQARCRDNAAKQERVHLFDDYESRVVLRSWIIWYLMNITEVRKCLIMYLFYDIDRRKQLLESDFDGFGMAYMAPQNPPDWDWYYCTDPGEIIRCEKYNKINNQRVDPDKVFKQWREQGATISYPKKVFQPALDEIRTSRS